MHVALRHAGPRGVVAMALQAGLRTVRTPIEFPVIVMARNERLEELQRTLSWKTLDRLRGPFDKLWGREFEALLDKAGKAAASAYSPGNFGTVQAAIDEVFDVLPAMYDRMYRQVGAVFADRAGNAARRLLDQEQRANVFEETPDARRWVREQTGDRIKNVSAATVRAAKKFVDRSFTEGLTTDQIAGGLRKHSGFSRHRAFRIARTEVVAASNAGNHFATSAVLPKGRFVKVWLSSRDIRVRDTHRAGGGADGQEVDLDDSFKLRGGRLRFPGDSTLGASAAEIIHCRCTTTHKPKKGSVGRRRRPPVALPPLQQQLPLPVPRPKLPKDSITPSVRAISAYNSNDLVNSDIDRLAKLAGLSRVEYLAEVQKKAKKLLRDANVFVRVDGDKLDKIIVDKRFKSQFETNTSGGDLNQDVRSRVEANLFSFLDEPAKRPIYGYLSEGGNGVSAGLFGDEAVSVYGNISVKFKKKVRKRTTFNAGDSIVNAETADPKKFVTSTLPSKVDNPSVQSFLYEDELIDPLLAQSIDGVSGGYVEAQIHGGVPIADVEAVFFSDTADFARFGPRLKDLGIKVGKLQ